MAFVLRAPEIIFHDMVYPTPLMDIWALGVLMFSILNNTLVPFESYLDEENDMIQQMVIILGKLPDRWWSAWAKHAEYFQENGVCLRMKQMVPYVGIGISGKEGFSVEEDNAFHSILYKMFRYVPEERIDANEVVQLIPSGWKNVVGNGRVDDTEVDINLESVQK
ncbi:hypothetical protein BDQ17DRAFT_1506644 [Cyathus striatus]|nr:hypothetical protein BDQ17DRAFT_1506644 [Cyathus striatus]